MFFFVFFVGDTYTVAAAAGAITGVGAPRVAVLPIASVVVIASALLCKR